MAAVTDVGFVRMRVSKVVGLKDGDDVAEFVVLDELGGDRHLAEPVLCFRGPALAEQIAGERQTSPGEQ